MIDIISKILTNVLTALYQPFWFSVLLSVLFMFFWLYSRERIEENGWDGAQRGCKRALKDWIAQFKASSEFRRTFFLTFYITMILFRTLLNRNLWLNPLSDVMGGWWLWETTNGETTLTTEAIENLMLFIPFTVLLMRMIAGSAQMKSKVFKNGMRAAAVLWQSVKITFVFSVCIEFLQLFLRLGTFQISDIVYNTLGGLLGGVIYLIGARDRRTKRDNSNTKI